MPFPILLTFQACLTAVLLVGTAVSLCLVRTLRLEPRRNTNTHRIHPHGRNAISSQAAIEPLPDFDWAATKPIQLRPFKPKYFLTMGLEAASVSTLINIDRDFFHRLSLRREILASQHQLCVRATDAVHAAVDELYTFLVQTYLPRRFPTMFSIDSTADRLLNKVSGESYPLGCPPHATTALITLGIMVDEDFMFLLPDKDSYILQGYVACFSSGFDLDKMLGRNLRDLHAEVPRYKEKLQLSMERWFRQLKPGKCVSRANWTITTHGRLRNLHGENQVYGTHVGDTRYRAPEVDLSQTHLRAELQQIHRLPQSHAVVFCYKTYLYPLRDIKEEGNGEALATAIEGLGQGNAPEFARYKGSTLWGRAVIEFLRKSGTT